MPRVWAEITSDNAPKGWWCAFMWTEVIDIGTIITNWAKTTLTMATIIPGCRTISERERVSCRGTDPGCMRASSRPTSRGSGLSPTKISSAARIRPIKLTL